jgi:3-dehydroquinate synthase
MEVLSNYGIPHGQAVVMGIIIADKLSASRGVLKEENRLHIKNVARNLFDIKKLPGDITQKLPVLLKNDKKASGNTINFVIIKDLGNTQFLKLETNKNLMCEIFSIISEEFNAL